MRKPVRRSQIVTLRAVIPAAEVIVDLALCEISFHEGATPEMIAALFGVG